MFPGKSRGDISVEFFESFEFLIGGIHLIKFAIEGVMLAAYLRAIVINPAFVIGIQKAAGGCNMHEPLFFIHINNYLLVCQVPSDYFKITLASWRVNLKHEIAAAFAAAL